MTQARDHQPPRRQDFDTFTTYDAAWKQWMVDQITHLHWCIDQARDTAGQLLTWMRSDELADARQEGAAGVKRRQVALLTGLASTAESLLGKAVLVGIGGGAVTFLIKVVGL